MGAAFNKSVRDNAPKAVACIDPFHAVKIVTDALDVVRRQTWNELRRLPDQNAAKKFKGARWCLLKRPENLTDDQAATLRQLRRRGGELWRAYSLKEAIRKFRDDILAAIRLKINNARAEGLNNHVRLITRRAYGFHSPKAALALVMLSCGPIELHLPHEQSPD
jgi:transposase